MPGLARDHRRRVLIVRETRGERPTDGVREAFTSRGLIQPQQQERAVRVDRFAPRERVDDDDVEVSKAVAQSTQL